MKLAIQILFTLNLAVAVASAAQQPLKVFLLVGQSNMQGHAQVRTFEHIGMDPKTAPLLREMQGADGKPRTCEQVWISYLSSGGEKQGRLTAGFGADENKIGPEFTFGIRMHKLLNEPILIIKTAWGGKSLHTDFRSAERRAVRVQRRPSSSTLQEAGKGPRRDPAPLREKATGHYYRRTMDHVKKVLAEHQARCIRTTIPAQGHELAGLVWFQGWNDMVDRGVYPNRDKPGGYDRLQRIALTRFIRDVRRDLSDARPALCHWRIWRWRAGRRVSAGTAALRGDSPKLSRCHGRAGRPS